MNTLPLAQEIVPMQPHFVKQAPHVRPLDTYAEHCLWRPGRSKQVNLRVSRAGHMDMGRFVIGRVDDEPEPMGAVNHDHRIKLTHLLG
jgi:hypothetical protein